ncbi:hypothetical protein MPSEU_001106000 [Mayamaea pseudoterrestris]|nr:hypothetical protein MPSEU_001106000 [Mayamaea pseudoterrestris]
MDKYRLVQELPEETSTDFEQDCYPQVRITQQGKPRNYISYALSLFSDGSHHTIVLKAMGRAINKAVTICEIIKRKLPVHQLHELSSVEMTDVYAPLEEGLDQVVSKRHVSCMRILLSLSSENMDINHYGYQPPLSQYEMQQQQYAPMQHHAAQYPPLPAQQQQHYYVAPHV